MGSPPETSTSETSLLRRIESAAKAPREGLATLLCDAVEQGASIGFLAPIERATADIYWEQTLSALGPGLLLWVVSDASGEVLGSVQLAPCLRENGRHRGEVQKLFVRKSARGRGLASMLMRELEETARGLGLTLLVLDTQAGSHADHVYGHFGWRRAGEIPAYAKTPDGALSATALYFKELEPRG